MAEDAPDDTLRERAGESETKLWVLLEARRWVVVAGVFVATFLVLALVGAVHPDAVAPIRSGDAVETLFQPFVAATITGVTLVVTLNQLVLSQELGAVGDQRERMAAATEFREDAADVLEESVAPADPSQFLQALVAAAGDRASDLREVLEDDEERSQEVQELAEAVESNADAVTDQLSDANFGTFAVVSAALNFNYSWKIHAARRLRADADGELADRLDALIEVLQLFGPAREHFKTLYFQWELIDLSRAVIATAIPSLVVATYMIVYFDPSSVTGAVFGIPVAVLAISAGVALALLPFIVLLAYVLRIATVAKHTLSIGPFTLRDTPD